MQQEKWMSLLGLANRAQKIVSGEELVIKEIKSTRAKLVLISLDASSNTSKKVQDKCNFYNIPYRFVESRDKLGTAIGKEQRVVVAVLESGFANKLSSMLDE